MNEIIFKSRNLIAFLILTNLLNANIAFGQQSTISSTSLVEKENALDSKATFQSRNSVILDDTPLSEFYTADITLFNFNSNEEAEAYFNSKTNNLLSYQIDFTSKKVIIHLHLKHAAEDWDKIKWTNYLNDKLLNQ